MLPKKHFDFSIQFISEPVLFFLSFFTFVCVKVAELVYLLIQYTRVFFATQVSILLLKCRM